MVANPAPLDLATLIVVGPQTERSETVDDRLVVVSGLAVEQVEREVKIRRADVRLHPAHHGLDEQTGHCSADDGQVPTPERATE
jgi:hypothetical protein